MLFTYLINRTDIKKSLYVNKVQILFFYSFLFIHALLVFSFNNN